MRKLISNLVWHADEMQLIILTFAIIIELSKNPNFSHFNWRTCLNWFLPKSFLFLKLQGTEFLINKFWLSFFRFFFFFFFFFWCASYLLSWYQYQIRRRLLDHFSSWVCDPNFMFITLPLVVSKIASEAYHQETENWKDSFVDFNQYQATRLRRER